MTLRQREYDKSKLKEGKKKRMDFCCWDTGWIGKATFCDNDYQKGNGLTKKKKKICYPAAVCLTAAGYVWPQIQSWPHLAHQEGF